MSQQLDAGSPEPAEELRKHELHMPKLRFGPLAFVMPEYMIDLETLKKMASRECMQIDVSIAVCMRIYTYTKCVHTCT